MKTIRFSALSLIFLLLPLFAYADPVITTPGNISVESTSASGAQVDFTVTAVDSNSDPLTPNCDQSSGIFPVGVTTVMCDATDLVATTTASFTITVFDTATVTIYNGATIATTSKVVLPFAGSPDVTLTANDGSNIGPYTAPAHSAIAMLSEADTAATEFDVSKLQYFTGLGFFVQCITIPSGGTETCNSYPDTWHFVVNGNESVVGMSGYLMQRGDAIALYFYNGAGRQVSLSATSVESGSPVTATLGEYDPIDGTYKPTTGFTIGVISIPDPSTPWIYTEIASSSVDAGGQAIFTLNATGTFAVGVVEDFFGATTALTVTDPAPASSGGGGGGGGGASPPTNPTFNIGTALAYVASKQASDGSFASSIITDWTALAFAAADPGTAKTNLRNYLASAILTMGSITDYERHAMALESLGINPYNGTPVDYITPIVNAFDGTQIGTPAVNDDIFGILALMKAGYGPGDTVIQKTGAYILSKQQPNGSWDNDPDMTAAGIQAVAMLFGTPGLSSSSLGASLGRASGFLASTQHPNASWGLPNPDGSIDSTSWVQTMINATNALDPSRAPSWRTSNGSVPADYIALAQQPDGGVRGPAEPVDTRVWSTSYAIVAASGKSWISIPQTFPKSAPAPSTGGGGGGGGGGFNVGVATSTATSTSIAVATSTPLTATSTPATATTSVSVLASEIATTTASSTPAQEVKPKSTPRASITASTQIKDSAQTPATGQAAAAAASQNTNSQQPGLLSRVWHSITSFFARIF